jgi:protein-S-isoprenylcysteine O-methyltransferase Ste14
MALKEEFEEQGNWLFRYRSLLPLIILSIGVILFVRNKLYPESFYLENTPYLVYYEYFCLSITLFGLAIRVYTVGHTPQNTSGRNTEGQVADSLNTTGIYSIVRHPLYLGNFFMWMGPALLTGQFWFMVALVLFYWLYYERIMFAEEQFLTRSFGDVYLNWAKNRPAFIPSFKNFKKPSLSFSWKKVLKKEKNGLAAVFIIFAVFDVLGKTLKHETDYNKFYLIGCIVTVIMYGILKYFKKYTNVLNEEGR